MYDDEMLDALYLETVDYNDEADMQEWCEFWNGDYDCDEYDEPDYDLELGFDPYLGCYTDDC